MATWSCISPVTARSGRVTHAVIRAMEQGMVLRACSMTLTHIFAFPLLRSAGRPRGLLPFLAALGVVGCVASDSGSSSTPSSSPTGQQSFTTDPLQSHGFGPLAVLDSGGGSDARGGMGPLRINDNCVTMTRENGEILLLVWHATEVTWDQGSREISFSSVSRPDADPIILREVIPLQ